MINEAALAMEYGASCEDVARVCHAHPVRAHRPVSLTHKHAQTHKLVYIQNWDLAVLHALWGPYGIMSKPNDEKTTHTLSAMQIMCSSSSSSSRRCRRPSEKPTSPPPLAKPSTSDEPPPLPLHLQCTYPRSKQEAVPLALPTGSAAHIHPELHLVLIVI